jgi:hypothetical protein
MQNSRDRKINRWIGYIIGGMLTILAAIKPSDFTALLLYAFFLFWSCLGEERETRERISSHRERARVWWIHLAERWALLCALSGLFSYLEHTESLTKVSQEVDIMLLLWVWFLASAVVCSLIGLWVGKKREGRSANP